MALLSLSNAYKSFGTRKVLENASLSLDECEKVAIIGKNGAGKSTLLKLLCQEIELDSGTLAKRPNLVARILPQDPHFRVDLSVREVCEASLQELVAIHKRVDEINALLQADSREFAQNTELLNELGTLTTQLDSIDGWDLEKRITELIENFHLKELQDRAIGTLSGGELKRLALATILMQPADLYILDEPTNHLDVEVVEFLESKLNALKACVLFISHDRYFIDNCARRIIEVDSSKLTNFRGGYGAYLSQKAAMLESLAKEHSRTLKLLKAEEEWLHKGVQARRKRNVLRKERVELLRAKAKHNPSLIRQMRLELERESKHHNRPHSHNAQKMIIECENLCVSVGGKTLVQNCSLRILQGDKIAIVGRNGAGKSSLLKVFLGEIAPQSGAIKRGELKIGYFAKEHSRTLKLLKAEEEWLHKGVQARRKRNVLRKERVELLRAKAKQNPSLMRQMRLELERESKHHNRTHSHNAQKMIIECENLCVSMGGKPLIKDCSLRILQGDKIAIVGRNGAGKSSLLKVFLGEIAPQSGAIKRGELKIGYFAQTRKELDDSKSLIETFCQMVGIILR